MIVFSIHAAWGAPIYDIQGDWHSKYGVISLKTTGIEKNGDAIVTGTFTAGKNVAPIVYGRFSKNVLQIEYYMHWRPLYGYAEFALNPQSGKFTGKFFQANEKGDWILTRRAGPNLTMTSNLPLITNPKSARGTKIFSVEGPWDSSFGKVELKGTSLAVVKQLKGTFTRSDGKVGQITFGSFMRQPQGGLLKLNYTCPWNGTKGDAQFRPDQYLGGKMLLGVYNQDGKTGPWILCRPADFN